MVKEEDWKSKNVELADKNVRLAGKVVVWKS